MSNSNLDMSLDDIIKMNKKPGGGGGGDNPRRRARNSGPGPGPARRLPNRSSNRSTPYSVEKVQAPETTWKHDMFAEDVVAPAPAYPEPGARVAAIETGTKLFISNLDYEVSTEDIKELFSEVGDLKRYSIHFDRSGRSKGTAEIVFSRRRDAEAAVKRYNDVELDGKAMKIEIVGTNIGTPAALPPRSNGLYGDLIGAPRSQGRGGTVRHSRGGAARGSSRGGRGRGRGRDEKVSAEDLDAELEKYHAEAMQTN